MKGEAYAFPTYFWHQRIFLMPKSASWVRCPPSCGLIALQTLLQKGRAALLVLPLCNGLMGPLLIRFFQVLYLSLPLL